MPASKGNPAKKKSARKPAVRLQYGALPFRKSKAAGLEVLLVTSRQTKRWIIPKGWPIRGLGPSRSAAREAYEEAGVRGTVGSKSIGRYLYSKFLDEKAIAVPCEVRVFALRVRRQEKVWPEWRQRAIRWFLPADAVEAAEESGLKALIASFASSRGR
ncbi:MAG TPA: NUDIX hydrolase [Acetobacteraceae bacterium]|nr:NUDIX hydrolase [Acetobacteraceae bacterium]